MEEERGIDERRGEENGVEDMRGEDKRVVLEENRGVFGRKKGVLE